MSTYSGVIGVYQEGGRGPGDSRSAQFFQLTPICQGALVITEKTSKGLLNLRNEV
jgi:hypothetical protein